MIEESSVPILFDASFSALDIAKFEDQSFADQFTAVYEQTVADASGVDVYRVQVSPLVVSLVASFARRRSSAAHVQPRPP